MNGLIIDKRLFDSVKKDMRFYIARAYEGADYIRAEQYIIARSYFEVLCKFDLLTDSEKINYRADLTELEDMFK